MEFSNSLADESTRRRSGRGLCQFFIDIICLLIFLTTLGSIVTCQPSSYPYISEPQHGGPHEGETTNKSYNTALKLKGRKERRKSDGFAP